MSRRPNSLPSFAKIWHEHETLYLSIFAQALAWLSAKQTQTDSENRISEQLCPVLQSVCFEESDKRNCEISVPDWEKPIPPGDDNELKGGTGKRPDFTCKRCNPFASCPGEHEIAFHVECKLLGNPTSKSWIINENYIIRGIKRFDDKSHEYGKQAPSGMMIGYIISMEPEQIIDEINSLQQKHLPTNPSLSFEFNNPPVFREKQNLKRKNIKPEKFCLIHLWADLRG